MSEAQIIQKNLIETTAPVNEFIANILQDKKPAQIYQASRHLIEAGGKRLRPFLAIKACEAAGGNSKDAIPFAAAVEILHNFTLVHDDVMDHDSLRRGKPTVHTKYGEPMAILAGDMLFAKVYQSVLDYAPAHISSEDVVYALQKLTDAIITLCEGQVLDISFPKATDVSEEDYLFMIGGKTSALFKACAEVGAIAAGAQTEVVDSLGKFAWDAGITFQIIDDILGVTADEKTLGKPVGSDIREGKKTIIMIHALKHADETQKKTLLEAMKGEEATHEEIEAAVEVLKDIGSIEYAKKQAEKYLETAFESLNIVKNSDAKSQLISLVNYFVQREY
ncbi:MAG: polyprenyl synthetase family protein [Candidatus Bathyarchaeota archaeon]|nr:polyprenyl synthetase family protein [Candidatus Bathyarchaeota archaeon]